MTLHIMRGIQGSGKTTEARKLQRDVGGRVVERDDVRFILFGRYTDCDEMLVTETQNTLIDQGLRMGDNVIVSDMNLRNAYVKALIEKAWAFKTDYVIHDLTNVTVNACVTRDRERMERGERGVGEEIIIEMYKRFVKGKPYPLPVYLSGISKDEDRRKFEPYVPNTSLEAAIIVDIDGTIARMNGRGPFDEHLVHTDELIESVADMVSAASSHGVTIIFMSGRTDGCYDATKKWLVKHLPWLGYGLGDVNDYNWALHMRRTVEDRGRPDDIVKYEMFRREVADRYNVLYTIDDRNKVVKMWRDIGLTCAQVAEGDF